MYRCYLKNLWTIITQQIFITTSTIKLHFTFCGLFVIQARTAQQQLELMAADTIICKTCHSSVLRHFTLIEAGIHSKSFRSDHQLNVSCSMACHLLQRNSDLRGLLDMSVWIQQINHIRFTAVFCQLRTCRRHTISLQSTWWLREYFYFWQRAKKMLPNFGFMRLKGSPRSCTTVDYVAIDEKE